MTSYPNPDKPIITIMIFYIKGLFKLLYILKTPEKFQFQTNKKGLYKKVQTFQPYIKTLS